MTQSPIVQYALRDGVAEITMDDGKANVMTDPMLGALSEAFARAQADAAVVLLSGRPRMFSGGYDLAMFRRSPREIATTLRAGGTLVRRILSFPRPVVAACQGHAVAQGAFMLLSADVRVGALGDFKIGLNEVAIGLTIPHYGVEVARMRLTPPWFNHATLTGTLYTPEQALTAGFFDATVSAGEVLSSARDFAHKLTQIDAGAHAGTKLRVRRAALAAIDEGNASEFELPAPEA